MTLSKRPLLSRRKFLSATTAATFAIAGAPAALTASKTNSTPILGEGDYRFEAIHNWPKLPRQYSWQTTHGVAVDSAGCLYVIQMGNSELSPQHTIFVFDPEGKYIRSFGQEFHGGGHGIDIKQEDGKEFLYVCSYRNVKNFAKLDLKGDVVWRQNAPIASGVYAAGEDADKKNVKGRDRFQPTNFAFLDDGGFLLADGYGSYYVHRFDCDGRWQSCFGGPGAGEGKFDTPHGIWIDNRADREPSIVVCDRVHNSLQYFNMAGDYQQTISGFGLPANLDTWGDLLVVPELQARISLLDKQNNVVARLGDDVARIKGSGGAAIRNRPDDWIPGKFVHPHDACFDREGNIFVAEWVATGRISKLRRLG